MHKYDEVIKNHIKCVIKVDLLKAYDMVSYDFLKVVLITIGLHPIMVIWIMICVITFYLLVSVNGEL